jgi:hypothetical protein
MITLHIEAFIVVVLVTFLAGVIVGRKFKNKS